MIRNPQNSIGNHAGPYIISAAHGHGLLHSTLCRLRLGSLELLNLQVPHAAAAYALWFSVLPGTL